MAVSTQQGAAWRSTDMLLAGFSGLALEGAERTGIVAAFFPVWNQGERGVTKPPTNFSFVRGFVT
jgi:hypothetical protein